MRKVLFSMLALVLLLSFVACRNRVGGESEMDGAGSIEATEAPASEGASEEEAASPPEAEVLVAEQEQAESASTGVTVDALANAQYQSEWPVEDKAKLTDGVYEEQYDEESASALLITLSEMKAFGDLNADGLSDAAAILLTQPGGSGTFYDLAVVVDQDGEAQHVATHFLGDRVQLKTVSIEKGEIVVEMITHGADDPLCCPTQQVTQRYQLQGEQLVDLSPPAEGQEAPVAEGQEAAAEGQPAPAEGQEAPAEGLESVAVAEGQDAPAEGQDAPAEEQEALATAPATEGQDAPAEGQEAPAEGQEAVATEGQGQEVPAEGQEAPAEGQEAPAEGQEVPAEGQEAVATEGQGQEAPVEGQEASQEAAAAPTEGQDAPAEGQEAPAEGQEAAATEGQGQEAPAEGQEVPVEGQDASQEAVAVPAEGQEAPAEGQEAAAAVTEGQDASAEAQDAPAESVPQATAESAPESAAKSAVEVSTTSVVPYLPAVPQETKDGTCWSNSLLVQKAHAWRCSLEEGQIYDPCFVVDDKQTVVCGADPISNEPGVRLNLLNPLPEPTLPTADTAPAWLVQLADGTTCAFATGASIVFEGKRVNYNCSDGSNILGELQGGEVWNGQRVIIERADGQFLIKESQMVPIVTIWEAAEPGIAQTEPASTDTEGASVDQTDAQAQPAGSDATIALAPEQVYLNIEGVANSLQGHVIPAAPHNPNVPPSLNGWPAHLRLAFDEEPLPEWVIASQRQVRIYPINEYRAMFEAQGITQIGERIDSLRGLLTDTPPAIAGALPLLPAIGDGVQELRAQIKPLQFQNGTGIRFITYYSQEANPTTNPDIFYTYQGITHDGQYYIAAYYPISASVQPNTIEDTTLNALNPADYTPHLHQLDGMIQSLRVGNN